MASPPNVMIVGKDVPQQTALLDVRPTPSQAEVCSEEAADSNGSPKPKPIPGVASLGQLPREPVDLPPLSVLPKSLPPKPVSPSDPMGGHECILLPSPPPQPSPSQRKPSLLERRRQQHLAASKAKRRLIEEAGATEAGRYADARRRAAALYALPPPAYRPSPAVYRENLPAQRPSSAREAAGGRRSPPSSPDASVRRLRQQNMEMLPIPIRPTKAELKAINAFILRREAWSAARRWDARVRASQL